MLGCSEFHIALQKRCLLKMPMDACVALKARPGQGGCNARVFLGLKRTALSKDECTSNFVEKIPTHEPLAISWTRQQKHSIRIQERTREKETAPALRQER